MTLSLYFCIFTLCFSTTFFSNKKTRRNIFKSQKRKNVYNIYMAKTICRTERQGD